MAGEPSVNPNALGAPAEGFGQTVSFAFDPQGQPPAKQTVNGNGPRVGVSGVSGWTPADPRTANPAPIVEDPTAALLMKAGGKILGAKIDEARTEQYLAGMQRAMSGEAIADVKESVPWWSRVFGDTPVIEGARAYTAQDKTNKAVAEQAGSIKSIQHLDSDGAAKHFSTVLRQSMTGDAATDSLITKQLTEAMPGLMKAQAKAHYAYGQTKAATAMSASIESGAKALQSMGELYATDQVSEADMKTASMAFVRSAIPPAGIDEENYQKNLTATMLKMAEGGQFHALEALRSTGVTSALTPEQATRVDATIQRKATQTRDKYAFEYSRTIAEIKSDAAHPPEGQTPAALSKRIDAANTAFQKKTGSPVGLFSSDEKAEMLTRNFDATKAEFRKAADRAQVLSDREATSGAKAVAAQEKADTIQSQVAKGNIDILKKMPGITSDDVDLEIYRQAKSNPQAAPQFLHQLWVKGNTSKEIAKEMQAPLRLALQSQDKAAPDTFFQSVVAYRQLEQQGGSEFADSYFGEHAKLLTFASRQLGNNVLDNPNSAAIWQQAANATNFKGEKLGKKETQALTKKIVSEGRDWLPSWAGGASLRDDSVRMLSEQIEESAGQWRATGLSDDAATARAISEHLGPDAGNGRTGGAKGEILGGYYIRRQTGSSETRLGELMEGGKTTPFTAVPQDIRGDIFKQFLSKTLEVPEDSDTVQIVRQGDIAGTPSFAVVASMKDGSTKLRSFSGDQLALFAADETKWTRRGRGMGASFSRAPAAEETAAYNAEEKRRSETRVDPIRLSYGPDITYKPGPNHISPYASASDRSRKQAENLRKSQSTK